MMLAPVSALLATIPGIVIDDTTALAQIGEGPAQRPAVVYVIPDDESGQEGASNTGVWLEQFIDVGIAAVIVVKPSAVRGGQAADLETLKEAVKTKLIGWKAPGSDRPTVYRGGRLIGIDAASMSMMLRFVVRLRVRVRLDAGQPVPTL